MAAVMTLISCTIPVFQLCLAIIVFHFALHARSQRYRLVLFLLFLYFAVLSFISSAKLPFAFLISLWAQSTALNIIHTFSILFIEKIEPPSTKKFHLLSTKSLCSTYRVWSNPQLLPQSKAVTKENDSELAISVFLLLRVAKLALYCYIHARVVPLFFLATLKRIWPSDVAQTALLLPRLWKMAPREFVVRSYMAVQWIWESLVFLDGTNSALAVFFVGTGFDQPADWPPLFGSIGNIRGLRSFWSHFWHKLAARPYKNCGLVVVRGLRCLGVRVPGRVAGVVVAFVVFLLSGLSHAAVSWRLGMRDWLDVQWFLLNFAACLIETIAVSLLRRYAARVGLARELKAVERSWLGRFVGCGWVFGFFFWSVPLWRYPRIQRAFKFTPLK